MYSPLCMTMKKEIELLFRKLKVALVATAISMAPTFAATEPSFVTDEAVFWLDAAAADTLSVNENGEVTSWVSRVGSNYARQSSYGSVTFGYPTYDTTSYGIPTVDFGPARGGGATDGKDLAFDLITNIRTVFWVLKVERSPNAFWLGHISGDMSDYEFSRGGSGQYTSNYSGEKFCRFWCGTNLVANMTDEYPASRFIVVAAEMQEGADSNSIGCDRWNLRTGGKQLSELIVFTRTLSDEERVAVTRYLQQKWFHEEDENEQFIGQNASFWLDAAERTTLAVNGSGQVTSWASRVGDNYARQYTSRGKTFAYPVYDMMTYGMPTVDFGAAGNGTDLKFSAVSDIRTVFWVVKIEKTQSAFLLGTDGLGQVYPFHRGAQGQYCANYQGMAEQFWNDTTAVDMTSDAPDPTRFQVIVAKMKSGTRANTLAGDRYSEQVSGRDGGRQLSELIIFEKELSDEQRLAVTQYLQNKWSPKTAEQFIGQNASFWLDAATTSTLTVNEDGEVTSWASRVGSNVATGHDQGFSYPAYDAATYGFPTVDFGDVGEPKDLNFTAVTGIRTVFMAVKIDDSRNAFWLGYTGTAIYDFHRGEQGQYCAAYSKIGTVWNGTQQVDPLTDKPDASTFNIIVMQMKDGVTASANRLTRDRYENNRWGGKKLSELVVFNRDLTTEERLLVTEYLQSKWTFGEFKWETRMALETPDDSEWRGDKYRVFDANSSVPYAGALAAGVGFAANATLDGGLLALGHAGFYVADGVTAKIKAPLLGSVRVYGPGRIEFGSAQAMDDLYVSTNATVVLKSGSSVDCALVLRLGAKVVVDVSGFNYGDYGSIPVASIVLPDGGAGDDVQNYLETSLPASEGYRVSYNAEAGRLEFSRGAQPVTARWKGGADTKAASNWECRDADGAVLNDPAPTPGLSVMSVTLDADLDLRGWGANVFANGVEIDLKGHTLLVDNLDGSAFANATITNSVDATTSTLDVAVANGVTVSDTTANVGGNVKFVKSGAGTFVASRTQGYTGGTEVAGGTLKAGVEGTSNPLGAAQTDLTVGTGATFDLGGKGGWSAYRLVMDGGTVDNTGSAIGSSVGTFTNVMLVADSKFNAQSRSDWGLFGKDYAPVTIDFGENHTLEIWLRPVEMNFTIANLTTLGTGRINSSSGGNLAFGVKGTAAANGELHLESIDLRENAALRIYAPVNVRDYIADYGGFSNLVNLQANVWLGSTEALKVHGCFMPAAYDVFYGCTMQDGSLIDLARRTASGGIPLDLSAGSARREGDPELLHPSVTFAPGATVTVDLSSFDAKTLVNTYVLTWDAKPTDSVKFVPDATTASRSYKFSKDDTGLKLISAGFSIFVR